jgi:long-chain fatty acid transport protein
MRRTAVLVGLCLVAAAPAVPAWATNGYQLIGVGQIQKSMAGAVTAAPMDTMTAITNPAGMARVGERADFSMEAFMPKRSVGFPGNGGSTQGGSELYGVPSVGWLAKAFDRDDVYFGGGMFATSGLGVDYDQVRMANSGDFGAGLPPADVNFSGYSAIQFWKMAPTIAWNQSDSLSLGASLNLDYQSLTMFQRFTGIAGGGDVNFDLGRPTNQMGFGATFGALYDVTPAVTLGASYATKQFFGDGVYRLADGDISNYGVVGPAPAGEYKLGLDYPQQAAVGIAVRPGARVLVDFDVKWINWSSTHDTVRLKGPTTTIPLNFGWDDQVVYALGAQWGVTDALTVRAGFNFGKAPIDQADVMNNLIFPALVEKHATLGLDYRLGTHWGVGGTFMKAFKETLTGSGDVPAGFQPLLNGATSSGATISLEETSVGVLLYYLMGG